MPLFNKEIFFCGALEISIIGPIIGPNFAGSTAKTVDWTDRNWLT